MGRKFLWDIMAEANVFSQLVDFGAAGHAAMCFNEGRRAFGLSLHNQIAAAYPSQYMSMVKENASAKLDEDDDDRTDTDS